MPKDATARNQLVSRSIASAIKVEFLVMTCASVKAVRMCMGRKKMVVMMNHSFWENLLQ
jgi:hypothetical protein